MLRRLLSLVVAAALVGGGVVRADEPPRPPEGKHVWVLPQGASWTAPACDRKTCGLCLDPPGFDYQVERVRFYETRIAVAEGYAESATWRGVLIGAAAVLAAGSVAALVRR